MPNVVRIYPVAEGLTGGLDIESQAGGRYTRVFHVEFDGLNASVWAALAAVKLGTVPDDEVNAVPGYGASHPEDSYSIVVNKTADPLPDDPATWKVMVHYAYPQVDFNAGASPPAPTHPENGSGSNNPPTALPNQRVNRESWTRQKAWDKDLDGNLIDNSADDPFDPPIVTEEVLPQWTFIRSQRTFDDGWKIEFEGAVNDAVFTLFTVQAAARTLKVSRISAEEVPATENTPRYYTVTITIQYDPNGWNPKPLDRGWRQKVGGAWKEIRPGGIKPAQPPLLDGNGAVLAIGGNPVFLGPFKVHHERDFRWLALAM